MIDVSGTPGFERYLEAKINCATIEGIEALYSRLYAARRALELTLNRRVENPRDPVIWRDNINLHRIAKDCRSIPSLAIVITYEDSQKRKSRR